METAVAFDTAWSPEATPTECGRGGAIEGALMMMLLVHEEKGCGRWGGSGRRGNDFLWGTKSGVHFGDGVFTGFPSMDWHDVYGLSLGRY